MSRQWKKKLLEVAARVFETVVTGLIAEFLWYLLSELL